MLMDAPTLNKPANRLLYLDIARALAIFLVCLNHAVNRSYSNYHNQLNEFVAIPLVSTLFKMLCTYASQLGVPLFLMISGVLLFRKPMDSPENIKKFYKKNLLSILITTEIWYVLSYWYLVLFDSSYSYVLKKGWAFAIDGMFKNVLFLDQITFGSMWYMPMILCIYTIIPFLIIVKGKLQGQKFSPMVLLPIFLLYGVTMVMPAINALLDLGGKDQLSLNLYAADLLPMFLLYILVGYFVGQGCLSRFKTWAVALAAVVTFGICCGVQYYAYSQPVDYLVSYSFPLTPLCAAFLFELFRRSAPLFHKIQPAIGYISRISFGIYFVHIVIMTELVRFIGDWDMTRPLRLVIYLFVSFLGSIAVIAPLSKIPLLRKYLFMIK